MLARYRIIRGKRPPGDPLPDGDRIDTRKHVDHVLAPDDQMVSALLEDPADDDRAEAFARAYRELLERRFGDDPEPFEELAERARERDVYLGCNCPTKRQPDVNRCHTVHALRFMAEQFPDLEVRMPES